MRQLTAKQKTLLAKWQDQNPDLREWNDLSLEQMETLEAINDTEIIHHNTTRFLNDRSWSKIV